MSQDDANTPRGGGRPLDALIRGRMQERGWTYTDLERASGRALSRGRWQQLGSGAPQRKFPDPGSLSAIAAVLEVDVTAVVLAAARSVGLDVETPAADPPLLLPHGTERLSPEMRDAVLRLIRAAVADTTADDDPTTSPLSGMRLEWPKSISPSATTTGIRTERGTADSTGSP